VVKACSPLCNQIRTQYEKTSWKFDVMLVMSLEVKVCKSSKWWVNHNEEIGILISVMFITQVKWTCINCP